MSRMREGQVIAAHPMRLGPALLHQLKQGKPVEKITVWFTHGQLHQLFSHEISGKFPLEMTLAEGQDMEQKIDCRLFQVPWDIALTSKAKLEQLKRAYNIKTPDPTPPELTQEEQALADSVFASYYDLAATEYQLLRRQVERELTRQLIHQQKAQEQSEDTPHE